MNQLLQETSATAAMEKIRAMNAGIVSFVLSRGFDAPISGKRTKLIELVLARYPVSDVLVSWELIARREAIQQHRAEQKRVDFQARINARVLARQERQQISQARINALNEDVRLLLGLMNQMDLAQTERAMQWQLNISIVLDTTVVAEKDGGEQQVCAICFDDLPSFKTVITGCKHVFCSGCFGRFAQTRGIKSFIKCPCCRSEIAKLTVSCSAEYVAVVAGLVPVPI